MTGDRSNSTRSCDASTGLVLSGTCSGRAIWTVETKQWGTDIPYVCYDDDVTCMALGRFTITSQGQSGIGKPATTLREQACLSLSAYIARECELDGGRLLVSFDRHWGHKDRSCIFWNEATKSCYEC